MFKKTTVSGTHQLGILTMAMVCCTLFTACRALPGLTPDTPPVAVAEAHFRDTGFDGEYTTVDVVVELEEEGTNKIFRADALTALSISSPIPTSIPAYDCKTWTRMSRIGSTRRLVAYRDPALIDGNTYLTVYVRKSWSHDGGSTRYDGYVAHVKIPPFTSAPLLVTLNATHRVE